MNALLVLLVLSGDGQHVKATIGDEVFAVYNFGEEWNKPFFAPVTAPGGLQVLQEELDSVPADEFAPGNTVLVVEDEATLRVLDKEVGKAQRGETLTVSDVRLPWLYVPDRNGWIKSTDVVPHKSIVTREINLDPPAIKDRKHPQYYDHPHHKGIWVSVDEVHGIKFWNEESPIRNQNVEIVQAQGDARSPAVMKVTNHWLGKDEQPILEETTTIRIFPNRLMIYDIHFKALQEMSFEDTKEGLFGIRLPNSMREMVGGGHIVNAEGVETTKENWGTTSPWIDYSGTLGTQTVGAALMDHPDNFRPSRYHVRDYGLFSINPFGESAYTNGAQEAKPVALKPDETVAVRYGLLIHAGDTQAGQVPQAYEQFLSVPR
jgi:hypothetical protein